MIVKKKWEMVGKKKEKKKKGVEGCEGVG